MCLLEAGYSSAADSSAFCVKSEKADALMGCSCLLSYIPKG